MVIGAVFQVWIGLALALAAAPRLRVDGAWAQPASLLPALYAAVIAAPSAAYLYLAHGDWMWMYLVPGRRVPDLMVLPVMAGAAAAVLGGWSLGARLVQKHPVRVHVAAVAGCALFVLFLLAVFRARVFAYGTHEAFHAARAAGLFDVKLGYVLVVLVVGTLGAAGWIALELHRDARRAALR